MFGFLSLIFNIRAQRGFGIIETIVAVSILAIIAATGASTVLHSFSANRLGDEETEATLFAQEGIEAVRSIARKDWDDLDTGNAVCGNSIERSVDDSGGSWAFTTSPQTSGKFTRATTIYNVCRDSSWEIDEDGDYFDPDIKRVTSIVSWDFSPTRSNSVTLTAYISNWGKIILICDWSTMALEGSFNFPTNNDAIKVQGQGQYAYVIIDDNGNPPYDFAILDVTDPTNPSLSGNLSVVGTPMNIAVNGDYAYVASTDDSTELQVIDISNKSSPTARGNFDAAGTRNAMGVYVIDTTVYLVKTGDSANDEFFIINASDPDNPTLVGSADIGDNNRGGLEVWANGNYAFIASEDQNKELKIVDISDLGNPNYLSSGGYDISGNRDANTIAGFDTTVAVGASDAYVHFFNVSDPLNVSLISTYQTDDDVNDLAIGESNDRIFEASNNNVNDELQTIDISDIENPTSLGTYNTQIRLRGVAFDGSACAVYAVGAPNVGDPEFLVLVPGAAPTPTPTPTPTTCNEFCQQTYGLSGSCVKSKDCGGYNEGKIYECSAPNICCCE